MSKPQYEPCEHRRRSGLLGGDPDQPFDTPCPQCEKAEKDALIVVAALVVVVVAVLAYLWLTT